MLVKESSQIDTESWYADFGSRPTNTIIHCVSRPSTSKILPQGKRLTYDKACSSLNSRNCWVAPNSKHVREGLRLNHRSHSPKLSPPATSFIPQNSLTNCETQVTNVKHHSTEYYIFVRFVIVFSTCPFYFHQSKHFATTDTAKPFARCEPRANQRLPGERGWKETFLTSGTFENFEFNYGYNSFPLFYNKIQLQMGIMNILDTFTIGEIVHAKWASGSPLVDQAIIFTIFPKGE